MLNISYLQAARELAYRQYMCDIAIDDKNKTYWDGACVALRQLIHSMQDDGESYPCASRLSDTELYVSYRVLIGAYNAVITLGK